MIRLRASRFLFCFLVCATTLGADCRLGYQVVDEVSSGGVALGCEPKDCSFVKTPWFELPVFADASVCVPDSCPSLPLESLTSPTEIEASRVVFATEVPVEITLSAVSLKNVLLDLSGPVTLRLIGGSSLQDVFATLSGSTADLQSAPRVYIEEGELRRVTIQGLANGAPAGSVELVRDFAQSISFSVETISVQSCELARVRLSSGELMVIDTELSVAELSLDHGFMASVGASDLRTTHCGDLTTAQVSVSGDASEIGPCDFLRFQASSIKNGLLDGVVHAESSSIEDTLIGMRVPTNLDAWSGRVDRARFCQHAGALRFDRIVNVICSSCQQAEALSLCSMNGAPQRFDNSCALLEAEPPECVQPWPESVYPN
jgi:hypothetical protein